MANPLEALNSYGQRATDLLFTNLQAIPPIHRAKILEAAMNDLHPGSHDVAKMLAAQAMANGANPDQAIQHGVTTAMTHGLLKHFEKLGTGQAMPAKNRRKKLGCVGCAGPKRLGESASASVRATARVNTIKPTISPDVIANSQRLDAPTGIGIGSLLFNIGNNQSTAPDMVQIVGDCPSPWYAKDDGTPCGVQVLTPKFQFDLIQVLQTDCHDMEGVHCVETSLVDATAGHRYGAIKDFFKGGAFVDDNGVQQTCPPIADQVNKDFIGLFSVDGQGGDDANKEPDGPIIATQHPVTGDTWGLYFYMAVPLGGSPWGCPDNPVSLLIHWKKVATCLDGIDATSIAESVALGVLTQSWLTSLLGIFNVECYVWAAVKWLACEVVDIAAAIVEGIATIVCDVACTPGLSQALIGASQTTVGAKPPANGQPAKPATTSTNSVILATGVGALVANQACGCTPPMTACPDGTQVPAGVPCPVATDSSLLPILLIGGVGLLLLSKNKKDHSTGTAPTMPAKSTKP